MFLKRPTRFSRAAFFGVTAAFAAGLLFASSRPARAEGLGIGDPAPSITVKEFVKGQPVKSFEKGKTYVVEFWATWCGPCKQTIPHLTELQKKYKDVKFVGVSVFERKDGLVKPFVEEMGDKMAYTVAEDVIPEGAANAAEGAMAKNWMVASGQSGIPTAFIVNGEGKIAWIGHPMGMEKPLSAVVAGKWDIAKAAADSRAAADRQKKMEGLNATFSKAFKEGGPTAVVAAMDKEIAADPSLEPVLGMSKFMLMRRAGKDGDAAKYGRRLVDDVVKDDAETLNTLAWGIVDPQAPAKPTAELVAVAVAAAKRADSLSGGKESAIADTLAKALFDSGDVKGAIEAQERAVKLAGATPDKELTERLAEYRKAAGAAPKK